MKILSFHKDGKPEQYHFLYCVFFRRWCYALSLHLHTPHSTVSPTGFEITLLEFLGILSIVKVCLCILTYYEETHILNGVRIILKDLLCYRIGYITLKCGTVLRLSDLEAARLSYVPCGQIDGEDQPLLKFAHLWGQRRHVTQQTYGKKVVRLLNAEYERRATHDRLPYL